MPIGPLAAETPTTQTYTSDLTRSDVVKLLAGIPAEDPGRLAGVVFDGLDLSGLKFDHLDLSRASFRGCTFNRASFFKSELRDADFTDAVLCDVFADAALIGYSKWHGAKLRNVILNENAAEPLAEHVDFSGAELFNVKLRCSNLLNASFCNALLNRVQFDDTRLDNVDWTGATVIGCSFVDVSGRDGKPSLPVGTEQTAAAKPEADERNDDEDVYTFDGDDADSLALEGVCIHWNHPKHPDVDLVTHRRNQVYTPSGWLNKPTGFRGPIDSSRFEVIHHRGVTAIELLDVTGFVGEDGKPVDSACYYAGDEEPEELKLAQNGTAASWGRALAKLLEFEGNVTDEQPKVKAELQGESDDRFSTMTVDGQTWTIRWVDGNSGLVHYDVAGRTIILGSSPDFDSFGEMMLKVMAVSTGDEDLEDYADSMPDQESNYRPKREPVG